MKRKLFCAVALFFGLLVSGISQETAPTPADLPEVTERNNTIFAKGLGVSETVSATTGTAISPLFGMTALGAWQYLKAEPEERARLPWYTHPYFWGSCLVVLLMIHAKDSLGAAVPELVKKPLTVLEVWEDKISALVVAFAVLPAVIASEFPEPTAGPEASVLSGGPAFLASVTENWPLALLMVPVCLVVFFVIWIVSHAVNCLLVLSPSSLINSGVKLAKGVFLSVFAGLAILSPTLGLVMSLIIFGICLFFAGWAFRWSTFGTVFTWDYLRRAHLKPFDESSPIKGFAGGSLEETVKPRSWGRVERREDGRIVFRYHPWLVLPLQEVVLHEETAEGELIVRNGLLHSSIVLKRSYDAEPIPLVNLRPKMNTHEGAIASRIGASEVIASPFAKGFSAAWGWIKAQFSQGPALVQGRLETNQNP